MTKEHSNGATASYYELPAGATQLQDLISHRDMNAQIGEIFRACYRYGLVSHSDRLRDARKILFYAQAEVERLERERDEWKARAERAYGWLDVSEAWISHALDIAGDRRVPADDMITDGRGIVSGARAALAEQGEAG